jgi:hypothetical protein
VLVIEAARLAAAASGAAGGALARASLALHRQLDQDWDRALELEQTAGLLL